MLDLQNKNILVTGAAGFIGSHLVDSLLEKGAKVTGVDNFLTGNIDNLTQAKRSANFTFIQADAIEPPQVFLPADYHPDIVFHLASPASPPLYQKNPVETYLVNTMGTHQLLSWLLEHSDTESTSRFVFTSTSEVYGDPLEHPQKETYWGNVNPNGPRSCYDESKRMGETICGVFHRDFGLDVRIARIFNTYGPRMSESDGRIIPNLVSQAKAGEPFTIYGDGSQTRAYCYVADLVDGLLRLVTVEEASGKTVNLGNPEEMTILETAKQVHATFASTNQPFATVLKPLPVDDPVRRCPDISLAKSLLGWQPTTPFAQGLEMLFDDYHRTI
ncbi:MAG TPA: GDP-mannose 4,6-dehydratase [Candidatus Woesebacteria bacterium]|nr:GDP-mannose 4,6-dehydratase [Candidatus Woesebacteria bacterium]HNS65224.1 GDP-mannose 4,6-dehydratase [Candidatus Woesebacteria bacterium]